MRVQPTQNNRQDVQFGWFFKSKPKMRFKSNDYFKVRKYGELGTGEDLLKKLNEDPDEALKDVKKCYFDHSGTTNFMKIDKNQGRISDRLITSYQALKDYIVAIKTGVQKDNL